MIAFLSKAEHPQTGYFFPMLFPVILIYELELDDPKMYLNIKVNLPG